MTQHIEEARKMEPIAAYTIDHTGCWHMSGDVQVLEEIAAKGSLGPTEVVYLVRLSDAQAAIAAAEERGRMEERERFREAIIPAYMGLLVLKTMCRRAKLIGGVAATESALSSLVSVMPELPAISALRTPAITKEPTP